MKKYLFGAFALATALFLVSCKSNPVETEAYKSLKTGLETQKNDYTSNFRDGMDIETNLNALKAVIAKTTNPDTNLVKMGKEMESMLDNLVLMKQKHALLLSQHDEMLKAHESGKVKMDQVNSDFEKMKQDFETMKNEVATMKQGIATINSTAGSMLEAAVSKSQTPAPAKK